jgi:hypothetical protein
MSNPFDQFDAAPAAAPAKAAAPTKAANPFDKFDATPVKARANPIMDAIESFRTGVLQGGVGTAGSVSQARPGGSLLDTAVGMADDVENLYRTVRGQPVKKRQPFSSGSVPGLKTGLTGAPAAEDLTRAVQAMAGKYHTPETTAGRYAQSIGQMTPALAAPGSAPARLANTIVPGLAGQGAADAAKALGGGERTQQVARMVGLIGGGLAANVRTPSLASLPPPAPRPTRVLSPEQRNIRTLEDAGVFMTPGQRAGGQMKNMEDLAARAPVLGAAVKGARGRSVESLNRAVGHRALDPLGEGGVPANIATGHDTVKYVAHQLGKAYDRAADMVPETALDQPFNQHVGEIRQNLLEQPDSVGRQFDAIVSNRLSHLTDGPVSGRQVRDAQSQIGKIAADFSSSEDSAQRALGGALDDLSSALGDIIGRGSPEAADLIGRANQGYAVYTRMRNAASKAKGGIFTPGQLSTAVRTMDKSVGKGNVAKGQAVLQDLSNAAWEALPDSYGNPGTADALSAFGLAGAMVNPSTAPVAIPAGVGLTGAAIPYALMGRKATTGLPLPLAPKETGGPVDVLRLIPRARVKIPDGWIGSSGIQAPTQQGLKRQ